MCSTHNPKKVFLEKHKRKEGKTREKADKLFTQFNSISFDEDKGKLESVSGHDDLCMGSFFAIQELRTNTQLYNLYYV